MEIINSRSLLEYQLSQFQSGSSYGLSGQSDLRSRVRGFSMMVNDADGV